MNSEAFLVIGYVLALTSMAMLPVYWFVSSRHLYFKPIIHLVLAFYLKIQFSDVLFFFLPKMYCSLHGNVKVIHVKTCELLIEIFFLDVFAHILFTSRF